MLWGWNKQFMSHFINVSASEPVSKALGTWHHGFAVIVVCKLAVSNM